MPVEWLPQLAAMKFVQFVEEYPELTFRNSTTRWIIQSNMSGVTLLYANGVTGTGQIVGLMDGQLAINHCSFQDTANPIGPLHRKIQAYNTSTGYDFHGTHTGGTAIGDPVGGTTGDTRGMRLRRPHRLQLDPQLRREPDEDAPRPALLAGRDRPHQQLGQRRHPLLRRPLPRHRQLLLAQRRQRRLFAVSNGSISTNPENAKNCIGVGASALPPARAPSAGAARGPTQDGRRKPEVFAPGCNTLSSTGSSGCSVASSSGTSTP